MHNIKDIKTLIYRERVEPLRAYVLPSCFHTNHTLNSINKSNVPIKFKLNIGTVVQVTEICCTIYNKQNFSPDIIITNIFLLVSQQLG